MNILQILGLAMVGLGAMVIVIGILMVCKIII